MIHEFTAECARKAMILTSKAFVPLSIKSSLVSTPNVLSPKRIFLWQCQEKYNNSIMII